MEQKFLRGDCQQNRSLEILTSIVVRENNPKISFEGQVFSIIDRF